MLIVSQSTHNEVVTERDNLKTQLTTLQSEKETAISEKTSLETELANLKTANETAETSLTAANTAKETAEQELAALKLKNEALESEVTRLKELPGATTAIVVSETEASNTEADSDNWTNLAKEIEACTDPVEKKKLMSKHFGSKK